MSLSKAATNIFICYRREDSGGHAGRLRDVLSSSFDSSHLFMDVDSIEPGEDWVRAVQRSVARCDILLAVIGKAWVACADPEGQPRINDPKDPVRVELETALRLGLRVIPVLVGGASMPRQDELPTALWVLARHNAFAIHDTSFRSDVLRLAAALGATAGASPVMRDESKESEALAGSVTAYVQWATPEVRKLENLGSDENWWVLYLLNSGDKPVSNVIAEVRDDFGNSFRLQHPPLIPNKLEWYILRPDSGIRPEGDPPRTSVEFAALGKRWRSKNGRLTPLPVKRSKPDKPPH